MRPSSSSVAFLSILCCVLGFLCLFPLVADAQTLTVNNDIQAYNTLANTTVTMTGRSELRITGTGTPISGCTINLNSSDAWLFLTNVLPSAVNTTTYLSQIKVNGAAAALNTNCRIVQYGQGAVVIPHASTFAPLTVYTGKYFTGSSMALTQYTGYDNTGLGAFNDKIRSFKLKRGYTATIAQNPAGTGISRNYVAQDGDIEVAVLPEDLDNSVSFIRVFPWRWTSKKGIAGNIESGLNVQWVYNWNLDRNSSLDLEYVPIRQLRYWPGLGQDWKVRGANHLLGYNEPDHTDQANLAVGDAIYSWPDLLGTGLRVGAPAVSDGGLSWLYSFVDQADAAGLRVDFVPVHYYRCFNPADPAGAANQFYNFLKGIYDRTKRPIWVTEWNNGANWTTCPDPTSAQQQAAVAAMVDMLENTPFVERYALYNWVEDVRRVKWDDGSLTAAGTTYRDKASALSYTQVIPEVPTPAGALYRFENDARDSSANGHVAMTKGAAKFTTGKTGQAVVMSGDTASADHVLLSPRLGDSVDFTFGAWVYWTGGGNWQRIFDLGADTNKYMFLSPSSGSGTLRFAIKNGGAEQQLNHTAALPTNTWTHVAVTISGNTGKLFVNGTLVATNTSMTINPVDLGTSANYLGKSQFSADPYFAGRLDEVQFLPYALADASVASMMANTPPVFTSATVSGGTATQGVAYTGSIAGAATDSDAGDSITYSKIDGPAWLTVAANGALSGTPTFDDEGTQEFTVYATDSAGATALAILTITLPSISGNGTWIADADGTWGDTAKWSSGRPASGSGYTADFSTLNITGDRTVTLNTSRTVGTLRFGDTSGTESWILGASSGRTLTLATASGSPAIVVNQNTATVSAPVDGTAGFTKSGSGTLVLRGDNSISGTINVDSGSNTANDGVVRLAHPNAAADATAIAIRANNGGRSTLELDGSSGDIAAPGAITLSGRNNNSPAMVNLSGSNTFSGGISLGSGGSSYIFQSDAGTLNLTGTTTSGAGGSRTLTFQGNGNVNISGPVRDGTSAVTVLAVTKAGAGTLTLSGTNTYSGATSVTGGTLSLSGGSALPDAGALTLSNTAGVTLIVGGNETLGSLAGGGSAGGNVTLNATLTTGGDNTSTTYAGVLSGTGGFTKTGTGTMTLSGTNTFTGVVSINSGGALRVSSIANTLGSVSQIGMGGGGSTGALVYTGTGETTDRVINFNGGFGTPGAIIDQSGTGLLKFTSNIAVTAFVPYAVTLQGSTSGVGEIAGNIPNVPPSASLVKNGTGTWILSGANSYTGPTSLNAGTLLVNGSIASGSTFTAASGSTLMGSGTINGGATINGIHNPGNNIGVQTFGATLAYGATARLKWELGSNSITAGAFDRVTAAGAVTVASGAAADVVLNTSGSTVALTDPFWSQPRSWTILSGSSVSGAFVLGNISTDSGGRSVSNYGTFALQQSGTSVTLVFTPYPPQQAWQRANFGANWNNAAVAGDTVDGDNDGLSNLLEYVLASDPNTNTASAAPQMGMTGDKLTIDFTRNAAATDVTLSVLGADSPAGPWSELARSTAGEAFAVITSGATVSEAGTGAMRSVQVSDIYPAGDSAHPTRFLRLRVEH